MSKEFEDLETLTLEIINLFKSDLSLEEKKEKLDAFHDFELSLCLLELTQEERNQFFLLFDASSIASILSQLDEEEVIPIIKDMEISRVSKVFNEMQSDDLVDIIKEMDKEDQTTYLSLINPHTRPNIKQLINFDETVVGSIMNTSYVEIKKTDTIKQAIRKVVDQAPDVEFISNIYVTDLGYLEGAISLKELISSGNHPEMKIEEIMATNIIASTPETKNEEAIELMKNYDFLLLPIVDKNFKMLGIVSFDDMVEALNEESDADYSRLAGVTDIHVEEHETIFSTVKKRMPWLFVLLFINLITSSIVRGYSGVLTAIPMLALFMPLLSNMAGNSGTQSLGVIIRLFAKSQLETKTSVFKHLLKEFLTGLVNGIIIASFLFVMVIIMKMLDHQTFKEVLPFASVIALAISVALTVSTLAGALVPLIMKWLKIDPAVASGPFITTISDITTLVIYFGLASILLASLL